MTSTRDGKPWASFPWRWTPRRRRDPCDPGAGSAVWRYRGHLGPETHQRALRFYCKGRLGLGTWTGRDGEVKAGLNIAAWEVQPMGKAEAQGRPRDQYGRVQDTIRWCR